MDPEKLRREIIHLLNDFETQLGNPDLRAKVKALIPVNLRLRDLGASLIDPANVTSARERIRQYLNKFVGEVVDGDELMVVSGISEYARRIRELRVQFGWDIASGLTMQEMRENAANEGVQGELADIPEMKADQYMLMSPEQDREAAFRWSVANEIRKGTESVRDKILSYLRKNVGKRVTSEELRYVAGGKSEWARRTRELRTEHGWKITTKVNGNPSLPVGVYVLVDDHQDPPHDRAIKDNVRRRVLQRDEYTCQRCGWNQKQWDPADPRHLEVHHLQHHARGGSNEADNLITYCNICHDDVHMEEGRKND